MRNQLFILGLILVTLSSCGKDPQELLLGEWKLVDRYTEAEIEQPDILTKYITVGNSLEYTTTFMENNKLVSNGTYTLTTTTFQNGEEKGSSTLNYSDTNEEDIYELLNDSSLRFPVGFDDLEFEIVTLTSSQLLIEHSETSDIIVGGEDATSTIYHIFEYSK